ncbi:MAG TPA: phosphodiester glycosidase family protein [Actinophytocola sp.]|uniref:phosphodiester glycosidase family protein n=1 Tax=Actinophytocola sp. TaxID=1872138 RepID=UPI002DDD8680|nr:phosphodiester glycosidase family protein [Actinophytocola sp.]HEV2781174.1 phosphodiester glycosidase family protein [Actinophytocola sp.]
MTRLLVLMVMAGSIIAVSPPPTHAQPAVPASDLATSDGAAYPGDDFLDGGGARTLAAIEPRIETYQRERPVAPGVTLRSFDRYGPDGFTGTPNWLQADSLTVDLTAGTTVDYLFPGRVAKGEPLSAQAGRAGAVAAVNGDFFDINNSTAPLGVGIRSGELVESPDADPTWRKSAAIFTPDGIGSIGEVFFEGRITLPGGRTVPLSGVNKPTLSVDGIEAFSTLWGTYCRCRATQDAAAVTEVEVIDNRVTAVRPAAGEGEIPARGLVLVGRERGAEVLAGLAVGDEVGVDYRARTEQGQRIHAAINGRQLLVVDGVPQKASQGNNVPAAPRTAIGFSADGRRMFLLTADGRQPAFSDGLGLDELATMMVELGAYHALNLDGGGSTTIVAREPGAPAPQLENRPSDGAERPVPNGLALFAPRGSGRLQGFWVETALDPARASGASTVASARPDRVFPGLIRTLTAAGYDETYGPAAGTPRWRSDSPRTGTVDRAGVFRAGRPGTATVTAFSGAAAGKVELTVLDPLARLESTRKQVALTGPGEASTFGVAGYDRNGFGAPVEPADVRLSYDRELLDILPGADGQFTVTAKRPSGSALVTVEVAGVRTILPVTVGLDEVLIADFDDPSAWRFFGERAPGAVAPVAGKEGAGLRLTYDFTQTTQIRTGGALAPAGLVLPGQPRAIRLWVHSSGNGEWASLQVWDGNGTLLPAFRAGFLTYTGWRQLEFAVPPGTTYPLTLRRFYAAETRADALYQGDVIIDQLTALVPPSIDVPPEPVVRDPVVVSDGGVAGARWRFAVMSDAQFVARDPDSEIVRSARRTLREILAARPDFLLINGDLVDEASPADFALARRILDEELAGRLPFSYVPGNHERADNSVANFRAAFGDSQRIFDHNGTRFLTVDTSAISLRGSDWTQLRTLRRELDRAAGDRSVQSVVLVQHVPPRDPTPARASELSDRKEAATIESWLGDFRARTGKGAAFIGAHVGTFHASHVDGVPYFVNGNSGKNPSTRPERGGFTGWSLWGVQPPCRDGRWISAEVRPHVDTLSLTAPPELPAGRSATVSASLTQAGRTVPVGYPVTADWTASPTVHIGDPRGLRPWHTAWFDPDTGRLTAMRASTITLAVTVNGVTQRATVELTARQAA